MEQNVMGFYLPEKNVEILTHCNDGVNYGKVWRQHKRFLEEELSAEQISSRSDYSILGVSVLTLGLIMLVELVRHRLDRSAIGRPFFSAVLDGVYRELTTLGTVEFFIWLLLSYWHTIDPAKKMVFTQVHFTLFYTAILNAFQTVIIAFFANRVSQRHWVKTETLELNHYVEIREEFERVCAKLDTLKLGSRQRQEKLNLQKSKSGSSTSNDLLPTESRQEVQQMEDEVNQMEASFTEQEFVLNARGLRTIYERVRDTVRYPHLYRRYNILLVQVRFHELRVHFLQAYKLPLKFKISSYLIRSEHHILISLVHVSTVAWLLLTASINLLYYIMGIVTWQTQSQEVVGNSLSYIFFASMCVFILVSLLVYNKVRAIFRKIMHMRSLWDFNSKDFSVNDQLAREQRALFWGSDPSLIISAIQFMQFGYAVALSVCIIFWDTINQGDFVMYSYILSILICYAIFVAVTAQIIPRYTLCTSLGQLVDKQRLQEAIAAYHLKEARQQREWELELAQHKPDNTVIENSSTESLVPSSSNGSLNKYSGQSAGIPIGKPLSKSSSQTKKYGAIESASSKDYKNEPDTTELMAELVRLETGALRHNLPESERDQLSQREERRRARSRFRTVSDGVAAMASMKAVPNESKDDLPLRRSSLYRNAGSKASLATSVSSSHSKEDKLTPLDTRADRLAERRASRRFRTKTVSDGVALMAKVQRSINSESEDRLDLSPPLIIETDTDQSVQTSATANAPRRVTDLQSNKLTSDKLQHHLKQNDFIPKKLATKFSNDKIDDDTISEGGHSDVDDIPQVKESALSKPIQTVKEKKDTVRDRLYRYFVSRKYTILSNVCGTMIAFYFAGERVERFLHTDALVTQVFISFDLHQAVSFYFLTCWMFSFLLNDVLVFWVLKSVSKPLSKKERCVGVAAVLDFLLISACVTMLFVAEAQRCCKELDSNADEHIDSRNLAEHKSKGNSHKLEPAPCDCPMFGFRLYGGIGHIEPYVSILTLRLLRHWLAKRIVSLYDTRIVNSDPAPSRISYVSPLDLLDENHGRKHAEKHGTIVELWEIAMGKYPETVEKYGKFSGELLQAMLGLPVSLENSHSKSENVGVFASPVGKSFTLGKEYSGLTPQAQEIVMAGKLGQSVRACDVSEISPIINHPASIPEENAERSRSANKKGLVFQIDETPAEEDEVTSQFIMPYARLVRSMRRCERKLLPYIDSWTVVDVVMTRYEMVYFDATNVDDSNEDKDLKDTKSAIAATKGGKGLRLCDVCKGRKVVGHLALSDIKSVHVERTLPTSSITDKNGPGVSVNKNEYWIKDDDFNFSKDRRWNDIKQDCVTIETTHGQTLFLRFYSDLDDCENHLDRMQNENEETGSLYKNNAFQWAQTIGRFCGPDKLQQPLDHFGEDNSDELRDYLVVHNTDSEHKKHFRSIAVNRLLHRSASTAIPRPANVSRSHSLAVDEEGLNNSHASRLRRLKPQSSVVEKRSRRFFRKSVSLPVVDVVSRHDGVQSDTELVKNDDKHEKVKNPTATLSKSDRIWHDNNQHDYADAV